HGALALITGDHAAHLQPLLDIFKKLPATKQHQHVREATLEALSRLDKAAPHVVPIAIEWLKSPGETKLKGGLRSTALEILARLGPASKDAVPQLAALAKESYFGEQMRAIKALAAIGPAAAPAIPVLEELTG